MLSTAWYHFLLGTETILVATLCALLTLAAINVLIGWPTCRFITSAIWSAIEGTIDQKPRNLRDKTNKRKRG